MNQRWSIVRTMPAVVGYGLGLATVLGVFDYAGGRFGIPAKDPEFDETGRKLALRANMRQPLSETIEDIGEGRGMPLPFFSLVYTPRAHVL